MTAIDDDAYGSVADLYDYVIPYRNRDDVQFYVDAARAAGGAVLEIGCGTGRVLIPLARAGVAITGVDASPRMLEVCRDRLRQEPEATRAHVSLVQADMRDFALDRTFPLATIPFRPFQHLLTVDDQIACLQTIHRHLEDNGTLILDIFNPSLDAHARGATPDEYGDEPEFSMPDGRRVVRRLRTLAYDRFTQVASHELIYSVTHPDGRTERLVHAFLLRSIFRFEAEHLLARTGFAVEQLYASYDKQPYGSIYPGDLIFIARKQRAGASPLR